MRRTYLLGFCSLIAFLNAGKASAQTSYSGDAVQQQLAAAIAAGQSSFQLPDGTIQMSSTLRIPEGTSDFTLYGQANTKLVRATTGDFPLITIGRNDSAAFSNTSLAQYPQFAVAPATLGATSLTVNPGVTVPPGWYVIAGVHPTNDLVRNSPTVAFNFKRELIRVVGQTGTSLQLSAGLGREFETPSLYQIQADAASPGQRVICSNITLVNLQADGRIGDITTGRSIVTKAAQASKVIVAGLTNNLVIDNVRVSGFISSGINVLLSRNSLISNSQLADGNTRFLGYAIEVSGSRFASVQNCTMQDTRLGCLFQSGSMDGYVYNCYVPSGRGSFDVGHGHDERRIVYEQCRADQFVIGNQTWLRGVKGASMINCTAYRQILVYGATKDVYISGKHPLSAVTTPQIVLATEANLSGFPTGPVGPESITFDSTTIGGAFYPGRVVTFYSGTGQVPLLGTLVFSNSTLSNSYTDGVGAIDTAQVSGTGSLSLQNCTVSAQSSAFAPFIANSSGSGNWQFAASNCRFTTPMSLAAQINSGGRGLFQFLNCQLNGVAMQPAMVSNQSGGTATVVVSP